MREITADKAFNISNMIFILFLLAIVCYPLLYIISASISDPIAVNSGRMWLWPIGVSWEGYKRVLQSAEIWTGYRNTIVYTLLGTAINLLVTLPCAYALSKKKLIGGKVVMMLLLFTMFFQGGIIPSYLVVKQLHMVNTIWAIMIPQAAAVWYIIVTMTFFRNTIPQELEEAAEIDGCSVFGVFLRIVLPLSAPIIAVMGLFYGVGHWNEYFTALLYLSNENLYPLQLVLRKILILNQMSSMLSSVKDPLVLAEQARIAEIVKYAVMIVASLPMLIAYPFLQRFFIKGVFIGSLKS
ncbi:carbohydrate ABC transporter permease [Cohnella zeiphila]|uniref:Carbohydrate ABC transporter permease n=1 Tax=Cohnella zeiphila TaxID=2761120 RepID=A0A7X0SJ08_9BACL|nr:carbohydrate ABC transporter permease [Cohnella zeiphila]MBB6730880.1 carbohydrate ABC transporter permease [Cohnella zeiphila]